MVQDTRCRTNYRPLKGNDNGLLYVISNDLEAWVPFKVTCLLQAFSNGVCCTIVQQMTRFQCKQTLTWSLCEYWAICSLLQLVHYYNCLQRRNVSMTDWTLLVTCGVFSCPVLGALFLITVTSSQSPSAISTSSRYQLVYSSTRTQHSVDIIIPTLSLHCIQTAQFPVLVCAKGNL